MADFTPNYNLKKPLRTEYYNVADANGNSDIVDTQLKAVNDRVDLVEGEVDALELGKVDKVVGQGLSDENYTLIEKNKVANLPDDTNAQLAEKVQNFKLKNEVVNGDFALPSFTDWFNYASTISVVNNALESIGSGINFRNGADYSVIKSFSVNDVVYARAKAKISDSIAQSLRIELMNNGLTAVLASNQVNAPASDAFYDLSVLYKYAVAETLKARLMIRTYYADATTQNGKKLTIDNVLFINLTSVFGAGNEPTKLEMDELMKVIPYAWWDGELSLTQKQYVTWLLNLQRKNTNAIIALGGTII